MTDDLNKNFSEDYIKKNKNHEFYKVIDYCAAAPKKYSMMCITPENVNKTKTKINGINQNNCIYQNSLTEKEETKITHESFKDMYLNTVNFNDSTEEDINFLFKNDNKFIMPERLRKHNYNRTTKDINQNVPWFSIHSSTLERTLFKEDWKGRDMFKYPYTVPNYSYYNIYKNWLNEF